MKKNFFCESEEYSNELHDIVILFSLYYIQGIYWIQSPSGNVLKIKSLQVGPSIILQENEFMGSWDYP